MDAGKAKIFRDFLPMNTLHPCTLGGLETIAAL